MNWTRPHRVPCKIYPRVNFAFTTKYLVLINRCLLDLSWNWLSLVKENKLNTANLNQTRDIETMFEIFFKCKMYIMIVNKSFAIFQKKNHKIHEKMKPIWCNISLNLKRHTKSVHSNAKFVITNPQIKAT